MLVLVEAFPQSLLAALWIICLRAAVGPAVPVFECFDQKTANRALTLLWLTFLVSAGKNSGSPKSEPVNKYQEPIISIS